MYVYEYVPDRASDHCRETGQRAEQAEFTKKVEGEKIFDVCGRDLSSLVKMDKQMIHERLKGRF